MDTNVIDIGGGDMKYLQAMFQVQFLQPLREGK